MSFTRPQIGQVQVLVYRECPEGCWCATGESSYPPLCPAHRQPMMPGGGPKGMYDHPFTRRLGFAALFGHERAMCDINMKVLTWLGFFGRTSDGLRVGHEPRRSHERYFSPEEIRGDLDERGWDGERFPPAADLEEEAHAPTPS